MKYEVWLHFRQPKTLETVALVRVYAHDDRLRAEAVLENAQADFQPLVLSILQVQPGALVVAEMRLWTDNLTSAEPAQGEWGWRPDRCDRGVGKLCCDEGCQADKERAVIKMHKEQ